MNSLLVNLDSTVSRNMANALHLCLVLQHINVSFIISPPVGAGVKLYKSNLSLPVNLFFARPFYDPIKLRHWVYLPLLNARVQTCRCMHSITRDPATIWRPHRRASRVELKPSDKQLSVHLRPHEIKHKPARHPTKRGVEAAWSIIAHRSRCGHSNCPHRLLLAE